MERFNKIYPFTTENIAGYMNDIDLSQKKIITVTGSTDHIINTILKGADRITTFDINPLTKVYMDLKLSCIENFSFEEFVDICVQKLFVNMNEQMINNWNMPDTSKNFWIKNLHNRMFKTDYYNSESKMWQNMYLTKENYQLVQQRIKEVEIKFIHNNLCDLKLKEDYDYMFLSNISDYLKYIFSDDLLENYHLLINQFLKNVNEIYFAYLYDIGNQEPRSPIDDLDLVKSIFKGYDTKEFKSALESTKDKKDGVLILRRR